MKVRPLADTDAKSQLAAGRDHTSHIGRHRPAPPNTDTQLLARPQELGQCPALVFAGNTNHGRWAGKSPRGAHSPPATSLTHLCQGWVSSIPMRDYIKAIN